MSMWGKDTWYALGVAGAVLALHLAILGATAWSLSAHGVSLERYLSSYDSIEYIDLARQLLQGNFNNPITGEPEVFRTPGYPAIAAAIWWATRSLWAVVIANALLFSFAAAGTYLLGRTLLPRWASVVAALGAMAGFDALELTASGMGSDAACIALFVAAALLVFKSRTPAQWRPLLWRAFVLGLICGVAVLVRPVALYMTPLFALAYVMRPRQLSFVQRALAGLVVVGICALVLVPWYARNATAVGTPMLSTLTAYNITYYNIPQFLAAQKGTSEGQERTALYAELGDPSVAKLRSAALSPRLREISSSFLREHWLQYAPFHAVKTLPFFFSSSLVQFELIARTAGFPPIELSHGSNLTSSLLAGDIATFVSALLNAWPVLLEALSWLGVFVLALAGLWFAWRRGSREEFLLLAFAACAVLLNAALSGVVAQPRYRAPVEFLIFIAAMYGLCELWARRGVLVGALRAWHNRGNERA